MRIFTVFSVILMVGLIVGCGDDDEDELVGPGGIEGGYLGLAAMQAGAWAEHTSSTGARDRWEYLGEDTYNERACFLMEFEVDSDGERVINQIWIDKATGEPVLFVMKVGGMVIKMDAAQVPDVPGGVSGETSPNAQQMGVQNYTTPTGKTVEATVLKMGNDEQWISREVPFGMVKSIVDGGPVMELYDFGFSGAARDISKEEAENAQSITIPDIPGVDIPGMPDNPDAPDNPGFPR